MIGILLKMVAALAALVLLVGGTVVGAASHKLGKRHQVPTPNIARATSPEEVARGGRLFRTVCAHCHADPASGRPLGRQLTDFPELLGTAHSTNLTADPKAGVGAWKDQDLARLLRYGVRPDGTYVAAMPRMKRIGDQDIAALIAFMRSDDPLFAPDARRPPPSRLSLTGRVVVAFGAGIDTSGEASIAVPARGPTAEYGRYLATALYGCVECHTPGFAALEKKLADPSLLAGGVELRDPRGDPVISGNLTPHATGLAAWTLADFQRALLTGVGRDRTAVRAPMPIYRFSDREEMEAIFHYLRGVPPVDHSPRRRADPGAAISASDSPEEVFRRLGCVSCHGDGAPFRDQIRRAAAKPLTEVVGWIRNPEQRKADTQMPTFAELIAEPQAQQLAAWLRKEWLENDRLQKKPRRR
jgi:mono/diheme cytochrome c family protein